MSSERPVAIIGAGPVGLAAAAHLAERDSPFLLLERGPGAGHCIQRWSHVRLFSPWRQNIDAAAARLLAGSGWQAPDPDRLPTGAELIRDYLVPLADHPAIASRLLFNAQVASVGRKYMDKTKSSGRERQPFELRLTDGTRLEARAVIDASGTYLSPNPIGSDGIPVPGEAEYRSRITYGIPALLSRRGARYAGQRVLVVGAGHTAINAIIDLLELRRRDPETRIQWAIRRDTLVGLFGVRETDPLPARGELGEAARAAIEAGEVEVLAPLRISALRSARRGVAVHGDLAGRDFSTVADEIIVATGYRPDLAPLREVRLRLDSSLEAVEALALLIDPSLHSCGSVPPHGYRELSHPERDFFIIGMKSYGRAPTFLMATGYEQARSVAAALTGDLEAAARVEVKLPGADACDRETPSACQRQPAYSGVPATGARHPETPFAARCGSPAAPACDRAESGGDDHDRSSEPR